MRGNKASIAEAVASRDRAGFQPGSSILSFHPRTPDGHVPHCVRGIESRANTTHLSDGYAARALSVGQSVIGV